MTNDQCLCTKHSGDNPSCNMHTNRYFLVLDRDRQPVHATIHSMMAHDHINENLLEGNAEAGQWTVREVDLLPTKLTPCWCPYCDKPHGVNRHD